jgi:hypothetical protein
MFTYELFGNLININIIKKNMDNACVARINLWVVATLFKRRIWHCLMVKCRLSRRRSNHLGNSSILRRRVWSTDQQFGINDFSFFFSFSFSISISGPSKFQSNLSVCFSFRFGPSSFHDYLFHIKYFIKLDFIFNFILL